MNVTIVGTGYVGLSITVPLAYLGNQVTCLDADESRIDSLRKGSLPLYEPWLKELMAIARPNLCFRVPDEAADAISGADVIFIAVGTPCLSDGRSDLRCVQAAAEYIGRRLGDAFTVVAVKSTVPVGTSRRVEAWIGEAFEDATGEPMNGHVAVASNPEFLRQGSALHDTLFPDRVVVGAYDPRAHEVLCQLYKPILEQTFRVPEFLPRPDEIDAVPLVATDSASAELIKYAANAFLAIKISYINEIAQLAELNQIDVTRVAMGIGLDSRIGPSFLQAGIGWGGSCLGKDTSALLSMARRGGICLSLIQAAQEVNCRQRTRVVEKLQAELATLQGRTIGLLGLAFKPNTDDLRDAPALDIAHRLVKQGATVKAHDPIALGRARRDYADLEIRYCDSPEEVAADADALILASDWPQYRELRWESLVRLLRTPLVLDGRNFLDRNRLLRAGFKYVGMGI